MFGSRRRRITGSGDKVRVTERTASFGVNVVRTGTVVQFDGQRGLGLVHIDGEQEPPIRFHCIVIDDGSRQIDLGAKVVVRVGVTYAGVREAVSVHKLGD